MDTTAPTTASAGVPTNGTPVTASAASTQPSADPKPRRRMTAAAPAAAPLTRQQRDALIDEAAKGLVPENAPKKHVDPLEVWWPQIKKKLKKGYSVRQVHDMIRTPKINLNVGMRTLQRFIQMHTPAPSDPTVKAN